MSCLPSCGTKQSHGARVGWTAAGFSPLAVVVARSRLASGTDRGGLVVGCATNGAGALSRRTGWSYRTRDLCQLASPRSLSRHRTRGPAALAVDESSAVHGTHRGMAPLDWLAQRSGAAWPAHARQSGGSGSQRVLWHSCARTGAGRAKFKPDGVTSAVCGAHRLKPGTEKFSFPYKRRVAVKVASQMSRE